MKDFSDLIKLTDMPPLVALFIALATLIFTLRNFKLDQYRQKKNRLIDESAKWNNKLPSSEGGLTTIRSAIYDLCEREGASMALAFKCLNSSTPGLTLEHFRVAGHLYKKSTNEDTWIYKGEIVKKLENKHELYFIYFLASLSLLVMFTYSTPHFFSNGNSVPSYIASLFSLLIFTFHSYIRLEGLTKLLSAICHFKMKLNVA